MSDESLKPFAMVLGVLIGIPALAACLAAVPVMIVLYGIGWVIQCAAGGFISRGLRG